MRALLLAPLVLAGASLGSLQAQTPATATPPSAVCGRFTTVDGLRTLYLWGSPQERGFAQGWLLGDQIVENLDADLGRLLRGARFRQYDGFLLKYVIPRFHFSKDEEEELAGMLEGIRKRLPEEQRVVSSLGREIGLLDLKALNTVGDWYALGCSTFAMDGELAPGGRPVAARNFDFPGFKSILEDQHVVVVRGEAGRRGWVGISHPGSIALLTGMNEDGLFVSIHDVFVVASPLTAMRPNVPRLCALRRILMDVPAQGAVQATLEKVRSWPTLFGNNLMVVTPAAEGDEPFAGVIEYDNRTKTDSGADVRVMDHADVPAEPFLLCTNHHRLREAAPLDLARPGSRYARLRAQLEGREEQHRELSVPELFAMLSVAAFPVDGAPQEPYHHGTLHQVVALTGPKELHVKMGCAGRNITEVRSHRVRVEAALAAACPGDDETPAASRPAPAAGQGGGN